MNLEVAGLSVVLLVLVLLSLREALWLYIVYQRDVTNTRLSGLNSLHVSNQKGGQGDVV